MHLRDWAFRVPLQASASLLHIKVMLAPLEARVKPLGVEIVEFKAAYEGLLGAPGFCSSALVHACSHTQMYTESC